MSAETDQVCGVIEEVCFQGCLKTDDPYDVWKNWPGLKIKSLYNRHPLASLPLAGLMTVWDSFFNNTLRLFYSPQEYPIVRAMAALSLLNLYETKPSSEYIDHAARHLQWLVDNSCTGYSGPCWGLGFNYAVGSNFNYGVNTPLSTMTPYPLEAFIRYRSLTESKRFDGVIIGIADFFQKDLKGMVEEGDMEATSYAPFKDRIVTNAVSYTMYSLSLLLPFLATDKRATVTARIHRLYNYIVSQQQSDGSWLYSPEGRSFIDCFHSCIVLKNISKAGRIVVFANYESVVKKGYDFIKGNFLSRETGLYKRFALANKPGLVRFDLYDNAEMINLAVLLKDFSTANALVKAVKEKFYKGDDIYSQIGLFDRRCNKNHLRWAVMPYLYAMSCYLLNQCDT